MSLDVLVHCFLAMHAARLKLPNLSPPRRVHRYLFLLAPPQQLKYVEDTMGVELEALKPRLRASTDMMQGKKVDKR